MIIRTNLTVQVLYLGTGSGSLLDSIIASVEDATTDGNLTVISTAPN